MFCGLKNYPYLVQAWMPLFLCVAEAWYIYTDNSHDIFALRISTLDITQTDTSVWFYGKTILKSILERISDGWHNNMCHCNRGNLVPGEMSKSHL